MKGELWESSGRPHIGKEMLRPSAISACLPRARTNGTGLLDRRWLQSFPRMWSGRRELHWCSTGVPWGPQAFWCLPDYPLTTEPGPLGKRCMKWVPDDPGHACSVGERALLILYHWLDQPLKPCPQRKRLQSCPEFSIVPGYTCPAGCPLQGSPEVWAPDLRCLAGVSNPIEIPVSHDVLAIGALMHFIKWLFSFTFSWVLFLAVLLFFFFWGGGWGVSWNRFSTSQISPPSSSLFTRKKRNASKSNCLC